ncbi:lysylphosphatidylglycerol synthase transmembrane domain-containing protein [Roseobacter litoralis]|uniref:lysylphosphatidylglycerol synthase transmembrane domain-containing protein n=1 Tax=Roseobacter litoralis TaxID=42443 RepID=UPI0024934704|nr:lysylphosphatidylglycerol synthase transmembrane domain-containing protein [Roseobacter litoralis]
MNAKHILKLAFGLSLLAALFLMADFQALAVMVQQMHWGYGFAGFAAFAATSALDMWRLRMASPSAAQIRWFAFCRMHIESYAMAPLLPGHIGVDAYRVATIGRGSGKGYVEPAVILFGLRVFSLLTMLGLAVALFLVLPQWRALYAPFVQGLMSLPAWGGALTGIATLLSVVLGWLVWHRFGQRVQHRLAGVHQAWNALTRSRLMRLVAMSLAMIILRIATFLLTLQAFGIEMDIWLGTSVALCAALAWLLPLSPAGIGVREGVIVGLLVWLGIAYAPALAVALLNRAYFVLFAGIGGVSFLLPKTDAKLATQENHP